MWVCAAMYGQSEDEERSDTAGVMPSTHPAMRMSPRDVGMLIQCARNAAGVERGGKKSDL